MNYLIVSILAILFYVEILPLIDKIFELLTNAISLLILKIQCEAVSYQMIIRDFTESQQEQHSTKIMGFINEEEDE